jgi:nucleoside 2-deoxyribosyltransferase
MLKIYLAGPDVFLPDAAEQGRRKQALCAQYGFEGLYPLDNEIQPADSRERVDLRIYRANVDMVHRADLGIVNLTPFRGPSADVGTVFELGLLAGLRKPVFGYTNDAATLLERIKRLGKVTKGNGRWRDLMDMTVEDFGNADNLMIDMSLLTAGHPIVRHQAAPNQRFHDLAGFEQCLELAGRSLSVAAPVAARHMR